MEKVIHYILNKIQAQKYVINKFGIFFFLINKIKVLLIKHIPNLVLLIIFFPLALITRLISSFYLIRFQPVISFRLGHYVAEMELYLCEKKFRINTPKAKYIDFFFNMYEGSCNNYFEKLLKKKVNLIPYRIGNSFFLLNKLFNFILLKKKNIFEIGRPKAHDRDVNNLFNRSKVNIKIPKNDIEKGYKFLESLGIKRGSKFVCVAFRDKSYLEKKFPQADYNYHYHRNANINSFIKSAKYLISKGYYVFRMGRQVKKKINLNHPKMIDYATSNFKSDFLDAFLSHECHFYVTSGSGAETFAYIFRKPMVYCSFVDFFLLNTFNSKNIYIFKNYILKKKKLTLSEIGKRYSNVMKLNYIKKLNIKFKENSSKEILETIKEMLSNLKKKNKSRIEFKLQKKFRNNFKRLIKINNLQYWHGKIRGSVGIYFLKRNLHLLK